MAMLDGDPVTIDTTMRPKPASAAGDRGTPGTQIQQLLADNEDSPNIANSNLGPKEPKVVASVPRRKCVKSAFAVQFCFRNRHSDSQTVIPNVKQRRVRGIFGLVP